MFKYLLISVMFISCTIEIPKPKTYDVKCSEIKFHKKIIWAGMNPQGVVEIEFADLQKVKIGPADKCTLEIY